jgi:hypothetical protein
MIVIMRYANSVNKSAFILCLSAVENITKDQTTIFFSYFIFRIVQATNSSIRPDSESNMLVP